MQLGAVSLDPPSIELETRRREIGLLHLQIDRTALRALAVWDAQTDALREQGAGEVVDDRSQVLILHLWATWCGPCKEEFPIWGAMTQHLAARYKGSVRVVHVALQNESSDMSAFVHQLKDKLPFSIAYFDRSELVQNKLRQAFDNSQPPLPLTLILDSERVVRQAFLGPVHNRRQELVDAAARLLRLVHEQQDAARQPSPLATPSTPLAAAPHAKAPTPTDKNDGVQPKELTSQEEIERQARRAEIAGPKDVLLKPNGYLAYKTPPLDIRDEVTAPSMRPFTANKLVPQTPASRRPRWRLILGGLGASAGLVLVGFGASALDVQGTCAVDPMSLRQTCDYYYGTVAIGGSLVGLGGALTASGIVLMAVPGG